MAIKEHARGLSLVVLVKDIPDGAGGTILTLASTHTAEFYWKKQFEVNSEASADVSTDLATLYDDDQEARLEVRTGAQTEAMDLGIYELSLRLVELSSGSVRQLMKKADRKIQIVQEATNKPGT